MDGWYVKRFAHLYQKEPVSRIRGQLAGQFPRVLEVVGLRTGRDERKGGNIG